MVLPGSVPSDSKGLDTATALKGLIFVHARVLVVLSLCPWVRRGLFRRVSAFVCECVVLMFEKGRKKVNSKFIYLCVEVDVDPSGLCTLAICTIAKPFRLHPCLPFLLFSISECFLSFFVMKMHIGSTEKNINAFFMQIEGGNGTWSCLIFCLCGTKHQKSSHSPNPAPLLFFFVARGHRKSIYKYPIQERHFLF